MKLINRIFEEKTLNEIIYFDDYPIFEEVSGKHMIHSYHNSIIDNECLLLWNRFIRLLYILQFYKDIDHVLK